MHLHVFSLLALFPPGWLFVARKDAYGALYDKNVKATVMIRRTNRFDKFEQFAVL